MGAWANKVTIKAGILSLLLFWSYLEGCAARALLGAQLFILFLVLPLNDIEIKSRNGDTLGSVV